MKNDQGSASYEEIFNDVVNEEMDEARTVLSPAAYFTDLMLLKENELQKTFEEDIDRRRPDISAIPLNQENTFNEIPYLDIVNEVMADRMEKELDNDPDFNAMDAFDVLKSDKTSHPFQSVFDKDHVELQHILKYHKTDLAELYKKFTDEHDPDRIARDYLAITKVARDLLIDKNSTVSSLQKRWGLDPNEDPVEVLKNLQTMLKKAGLSDKEFQRILSQNLSKEELQEGKAGEFFINNVMMPGNPRAEKAAEIYANTGKRIWQAFGGAADVFAVVDMLPTSSDEDISGLTPSRITALAQEFGETPFASDFSLNLTRREYRIKYHSRKMVREWAQKLAYGNLNTEADIDHYAKMLEDVYKIKNCLEPITVVNDRNAFWNGIQEVWDTLRHGIIDKVLLELDPQELVRGLTINQVQALADEYGLMTHPVLAMNSGDIDYWKNCNLSKTALRTKFHLRKLILDLAMARGHAITSQTELTEYANALEAPLYLSPSELDAASNSLYREKCKSIYQAFGGRAEQATVYSRITIYESENLLNIPPDVVYTLMNDYELRTYNNQPLTPAQKLAWANQSGSVTKMQYRIKFHCRRVVLNYALGLGYAFSSEEVYAYYAGLLERLYFIDSSQIEIIPLYIQLIFNEYYKNIWVQLGTKTTLPENTAMVLTSSDEDYTGVTKREIEILADEYGLRTSRLLPLTRTEINTLAASNLTKTALRIKFHSRALILKQAIAFNKSISSRTQLNEMIAQLEEVYQYASTKSNAIREQVYAKYANVWLFIHEITKTILSGINVAELTRQLTIQDIESLANEYNLITHPVLAMTSEDINYWQSLNLTKVELRIKFRLRKLILDVAQAQGHTLNTQDQLTVYANAMEAPFYYSLTDYNDANYRLYRNKCVSIYTVFGGNYWQVPEHFALTVHKSEFIYNLPASEVYALMDEYNLRTYDNQELTAAQKQDWADQSGTISKMEYRIKFHSRKVVLNLAQTANYTLPNETAYASFAYMLESIYGFDPSHNQIISLYSQNLFNETFKNIWVESGVLAGFPQNTVMLQVSPAEEYTHLTKSQVIALADEYGLRSIGQWPLTDNRINQLIDQNLTKSALRIKFHSWALILNYAISHSLIIPDQTALDTFVSRLEEVYRFASIAHNKMSDQFNINYTAAWMFINEKAVAALAGTSVLELNRGLTIADVAALADEYTLRSHPILAMTSQDINYWQSLNLTKAEMRLKFRLRKLALDLAQTKGHAISTQAQLTTYADALAASFYFSGDELNDAGYRLYKYKYESIWLAFGGVAGEAPATYGISTLAAEDVYNIPASEVYALMDEYNLRTYDNQALTPTQKQAWADQSTSITKTAYRIKFHSRRIVLDFALALGFNILSEQAYADYSAMLEGCYAFDFSRIVMVALYSQLLFDEVYRDIWIELGVQNNFPGNQTMVEPAISENHKGLTKTQVEALADEYGLRSTSLLPLTDIEINLLTDLELTKYALRIKLHSRALILNYAITNSIPIASEDTLTSLVAKLESVYEIGDAAKTNTIEQFKANYQELWETMGGFGSQAYSMFAIDPGENYKGLTIYNVMDLVDDYGLKNTAIQPMDIYDILRLHEKNLTKTELKIRFQSRLLTLDLTTRSQYELINRENLDEYTEKVASGYVIVNQLASIPNVRSLFNEAFRKVLVELGEQPGPEVTAEMLTVIPEENYCGHSQSEIETLADEYGLRTISLLPMSAADIAYWQQQPLTKAELRIKFHAYGLILNYAVAHAIAISSQTELRRLAAILEAVYDSGKYALTTQRTDRPSVFAEKQRRIWIAFGGDYDDYETEAMQETTRDEQFTLLTKEEIRALADEYGFQATAPICPMSAADIAAWYALELTKAELKIKFHSRRMIVEMLEKDAIPPAVRTEVAANISYYASLLEAIYVDEGRTYLCLNNFRKDLPTLDHLDLLNRFLLLCHITGWTPEDADLMLLTACHGQLDAAAVRYIAAVKHLQAESELPLDILCCFWAEMKNWGNGQGSYPEHLFYRTFDKGQRISILMEPDKNIATSPKMKSRVQSSIGLKEQDLKLLVDSLGSYLFSTGEPKNITLSNLTVFYRFAKLAKLYQLTIADMLALLDIVDQMWKIEQGLPFKPFISLTLQATPLNCRQLLCQAIDQDMDSILWLLQTLTVLLDWLRDLNLTVKQLSILCSRTMVNGEEGILATKDRIELITKMVDLINGQLVSPGQLQSTRLDSRSAAMLYQELVKIENDCLTPEGLIRGIPTFIVMETAIKKALNRKIVLVASDYAGLGLTEAQYTSLLTQLATAHYITIVEEDLEGDEALEKLGEFTEQGRQYFMGENQGSFSLVGFDPTEAAQIFTITSAKAVRLQQELDGAGSETEALLGMLTTRQEQQRQIVLGALETKLGLDTARLRLLCQAVYTSPAEKESHALVRMILPMLQAANTLPTADAIAAQTEVTTNLYLLQQFSLLVKKAGLTVDQLRVLLAKLNYISRKPEKIALPGWDGFDVMFRDQAHDIYFTRGDSYARYSKEDYTLLEQGQWPTSTLGQSLPAPFNTAITAAFQGPDGKHYIFSGNEYVCLEDEPVTKKPVTDFGLAAGTLIDAAFLAPDGKLYLFFQSSYAVYSQPDELGMGLQPDAGYPQTLAAGLGGAWPIEFQGNLDAAFVFEGRVYIFKSNSYLRFSDPRLLQPDPLRDDHIWAAIADKWNGKPAFLLSDILDYDHFRQLTALYNADEYSLLNFYEDTAQTTAKLSQATQWDETQINSVFSADILKHPVDIGTIRTIMQMKEIMDYCRRLAITPETMIYTVWRDIFNTPGDIQAANNILLESLKTKISAKDWEIVSAELHNAMNLAKRDALLPYLLNLLRMENSRDLYSELLLDVDMDESALTSRINEAIACAQLYYHRTLTNLETWEASREKLEELKRWWVWMKNYRVWEANRKVFLYPENYIRPELRTGKSPAFKALEEELLQTDITELSVQNAYKNYLEKFATVSSLVIAGGSVYQKSDGTYVVMFGYARTEPIQYYYRIGKVPANEVDPVDWEPWQEINILINAKRVYPVYAFNRLFVFWLEYRDKNETTFSVGTPVNTANIKYEPIINYSFYNLNKEWIVPQQLMNVSQKANKTWTKQELDGFRLKVVNPSFSSEYDNQEYIYIKYTCSPNNIIGRIASEWNYEERTAAQVSHVIALNTPEEEFPAEFGITCNSIEWHANFEETYSVPWFSFVAKGGSFLCKPARIPKVTKDDIALGTPFNEVVAVDAGFKDLNDKTHIFSEEEYSVYDDLIQNEAVGLITDRWGNCNIFQDLPMQPGEPEKLVSAFVCGNNTHFITTHYHLYYNSSNYDSYFAAQPRVSFNLDLTGFTLVANWADLNWATITNAFIHNGTIYVFNGNQYVKKYTDELLADTGLSVPLESAFVKDNMLYVTAGANFNTYEYETTQRNWKTVRLILGNTDLWGAEIDWIKAGFQGKDSNWYFFADTRYVGPYNSPTADGTMKPLSNKWGNHANIFPNGVDAAYMNNQGTIYLFKGNTAIQYDSIESRFPTNFQTFASSTSWLQLSAVDAIFKIGSKIYAFAGANYHAYIEAENGVITKITTGYPLLIKGKWSNLPGDFNDHVDAGFYIGDDLYLCRLDTTDPLNPIASFVCYSAGDLEMWPYEIMQTNYQIIRLTSNTAQKFSQKLFAYGVAGLLELHTQEEDELPKFQEYITTKPANEPADTIYYKSARIDSVPESTELDFLSANGSYYWEIFFHTPFLIAQALNTAQKQDEAQKWYHFVYDPSEKTSSMPLTFNSSLYQLISSDTYKTRYQYDSAKSRLVITGPMSKEERTSLIKCYDIEPLTEQAKKDIAALVDLYKRSNIYYFWKFMPFHQDPGEQTFATQYEKYHDDPFDPHAIAALRQIAYRKAIVMSYIDNLMDWGDKLFIQYTRESINEARMLYVLAYDLLGQRPERVAAKATLPVQNYYQIYTELYPATWYETLLELENASSGGYLPDAILKSPGLPNDDFVARGYFTIPENDLFISYWDRVEDRLYKIRHSLNIEGVKQPLPLFQPPIDPMALVQAVAGGGGLAAALADFEVAVPHYRFNVILGKTREFVGHVIQLGGAILSALEKKDAEDLSLLRNTQENSVLKKTLDIKIEQKTNTEKSLLSLRASRKNAAHRQGYYLNLLNQGLSPFESTQLALTIISKVYSSIAQVMSIASSVGSYMPNVGSPFAMTYGGEQIGRGLEGMTGAFNFFADMFTFGSNLSATLGGWHRRAQDWELQRVLATNDIDQIDHQIKGSEIQVSIAGKEIELQNKQIEHNEAIDDFLKSKFTNKQLYMWMISQIKNIYFQSYKMALELAKSTQKAFQYEMGFKASDVNYITPVYWDSLHEGLLAGEKLQYDLDRMEKAYLEKNKRRFEISKSISLASLDPLALVKLKEKKVCEFDLNERLFDQDFPGHYCRQIKTVSVSFPAIVGQYQNLNATLTQLTNRTLIEPDREGLLYLLAPQEDQQMPLTIRADWRPNQQVALSRADNDSGLFQLNFQDERYLPFEGTGAVSSWRLELNGAAGTIDFAKIQDVIIRVEYTALQGGEAFANEVRQNLPMEDGFGLLLLKQAFNNQWNQFMLDPAQGMTFTLDSEYCTNIFEDDIRSVYLQYDLTEAGLSELKDVNLDLTTETMTTPVELSHGAIADTPGVKVDVAWTIKPSSAEASKFTQENIRNIALIVIYDTKVSF